MSGRRRCFFCLAGTVILSFLGVVMRLNDVIGHSGDGILPNRRALHRQAAHFGRFVPVENGAELPSSAAAGLAVVPAGSTSRWFVALANFYGRSSLFEIDRSGTHRPSRLAAKLRQRLATRAAHDWEAVHLPGGRIQLVATEYDAPYSLVYELNESHTGMPPPRPLDGWPECADTQPSACAAWAASGECERNPGFMRTSCAAACGNCADLSGPLVAVQRLPGLGGTVARHVRLDGRGETAVRPLARRDLLLVANYKAAPGEGVALYEWSDERGGGAPSWSLRGHVDVPGAGEFAHCSIPQTGEDLVVASAWHANGSFATSSWVLAVEGSDAAHSAPFDPARLVRRQALPTFGSHDAECFARRGETYLIIASGRHDSGRRDLPSVVYMYDWRERRRFVELQRVPTVGAHDVELLTLPAARLADAAEEADGGALLAVVANGASWRADAPGDGEVCDNPLDVLVWDDDALRLIPHQRLDAGGCATFVRAWRARGDGAEGAERVLIAVAVERTAPERAGSHATGSAKGSSPYDASVRIYEWRDDAAGRGL